MGLQPSQFYLAFTRRICGEERVGCGEGEEPAKIGPKTIRCDGEIGNLLGRRMIAFLGCQRHLAGQSTFGSSPIGKK